MAEPNQPDNQEPPKNEGLDVVPKAELEKLLEKTAQSAADRVRTEYSQKLKAAQEEAENLRMEKMTAKERAANPPRPRPPRSRRVHARSRKPPAS